MNGPCGFRPIGHASRVDETRTVPRDHIANSSRRCRRLATGAGPARRLPDVFLRPDGRGGPATVAPEGLRRREDGAGGIAVVGWAGLPIARRDALAWEGHGSGVSVALDQIRRWLPREYWSGTWSEIDELAPIVGILEKQCPFRAYFHYIDVKLPAVFLAAASLGQKPWIAPAANPTTPRSGG